MSYIRNDGEGVLETTANRVTELETRIIGLETIMYEMQDNMADLDKTFIKGHLDFLEELFK